jgi:predicted alpha-1,2-mannosidase
MPRARKAKLLGKSVLLLLVCLYCTLSTMPANATITDYTSMVNVFVGTHSWPGYGGHCTPAAVRPWGMVSPGPDTDPDAVTEGRFLWENLGGYNYSDTYLSGFSQTHICGTGGNAYGQGLILPTTGGRTLGARSAFSHSSEVGEPGYYKVKLDSYNIIAEMTCAKRTSFYKFTFPASSDARILFDYTHVTQFSTTPNGTGTVIQVNNNEIKGEVTNYNWTTHTLYYYLKSSKSFSFTNVPGGAYLQISTAANEAVYLRIGASFVSSEQARLNLDTEIPTGNEAAFLNVKNSAHDEWEAALGKIDITGGTLDQQKIFYSGLYHAMWQPQTVSDVNGQYRDLNKNVYTDTEHPHFSILSIWDTFRAVHPLYALVYRNVQLDVVKSMLDTYQHFGQLPIWPVGAGETYCMNGSHADSIIADSIAKGITGFDMNVAWNALYHDGTATGIDDQPRDPDYLARGWCKGPFRPELGNVYQGCSDTLECGYDDWCISQVAKYLGRANDYNTFYNKGFNYQNQFNPAHGFMQLRNMDGTWVEPFNPKALDGFTESNSWVYTFHVLNDVRGLISLIGGDAAFETKLDQLFSDPGEMLQLAEIGLKDSGGVNRATGGVITARGDNPPSETKEKAFDNNISTKWLDFEGLSWIQYQFPNNNAYLITSYTITSANDAPERDPYSWTFKGSNDGLNWFTLDTRTGVSFANRFETKTFNFSNSTAYQYYKFNNLSSEGSGWGMYQHDNEPSHHIAYLYNYCGKPWKTQHKVRNIMNAFYSSSPDGLIRDDDCGQMSAWYVLSSLGFYPVTPGTSEYVIGSPIWSNAVIHLSTGNDLVITANNNSDSNRYIQSATLNGTAWNKTYFPFSEMNKPGASLVLNMGSSTTSGWGTAENSRPYSQTTELYSVGGGSNLGVAKFTKADGYTGISESPDKAVDGSSTTKWCVTGSEPHWIQIDLGQSYDLTRWKVKHAEAGGEPAASNTMDFKLQKSNDEVTWTDVDSVIGNIAAITDRMISKTTARYVRIYITKATQTTDTAARIYEFEVYGSVSNNIALNKTAAANQYVAGEEPFKAVDGSVLNNSKWCSTAPGDKWLRLDLGQSYNFNRWVVKHAGAGGEDPRANTRDFKLQKSVDGSNWTDVDTVTGNTADITDRAVAVSNFRYVRLYITNPSSMDTAARIYEFELYDSAGMPAGVTFYQDVSCLGNATQIIPYGSYTMSQLQAYGFGDNWASSVKVPTNYTLIMYADDNFTGQTWTLTSDAPDFRLLNPDANDIVTSVKVQ